MQCTEYTKSFFCRSESFYADQVIIYRVILWSRSIFHNLEGTKLGKGMLLSVEQAFVGRDAIRAPLKTSAWEAITQDPWA